LITRPEESYRLWRVVVCDQETSKRRRLKPATGLWKIQPQWVVTPGKQTNKQTNIVKGCPTALLFGMLNPLKPFKHITDISYWMLPLRSRYWIFLFHVDLLWFLRLEVSPSIDRSIRNIFGKNTAPLRGSDSYVYHNTFVPVLSVLLTPYTSALKMFNKHSLWFLTCRTDSSQKDTFSAVGCLQRLTVCVSICIYN
jgi:hypothetical protein